MPKDANGLTPKQAKFVQQFLATGNASEAARRAGYSKRTAPFIAAENLKKPLIAAAIAEKQAKFAQKAEMDADEWRQRLTRFARVDVRKLYDEQGRPLAIPDLPDDIAYCVKGFKVQRERSRVGEAGEVTQDAVVQVECHDPYRALELIGKHTGWLKDVVKHEGLDLAAILREGRARLGEDAPPDA